MKQNKIIWLVFVLALGGLVFYFAAPKNKSANGDKTYGGVMRISTKSKRLTLFPLANNTLEAQRLQQLIFEPLLKPAQNERGWRYCLASEVSLNAKRNQVVIRIKKNIHFTDNSCYRFHSSELTAEDVAFSLSLACSQQDNIQQELILPSLIVGGTNFFDQHQDPTKASVKGIRVLDKYTLKITLTGAYNHFLSLLTSPSLSVLSKQAAKFYGRSLYKNPVGTGPFLLQNKLKTTYVFERNEGYWRHDKYGNQLPYLDRVELSCGVPGQLAHKRFLNNQLDLLFDLPIDDLREAFGTLNDAKQGKNPLHEVYIKNAAKVHFIQFNSCKSPFDQLAVRQAFALVIDTKTICNDILKGEGQELNGHFIPTQKQYNNNLLIADPRTAQEKINAAQLLLAQAGFNSKNPLPKITFYAGAAKNTLAYKWSKAVAKMLRQALHIQIILKEAGAPQNTNSKNHAEMWRSGWIGDYPGAESYLRLFYSKAQNPLVFSHIGVDAYYLESIWAQSNEKRLRAQMLCEKAIIDQQALIPIYTEDFIVLNQLRVRGFQLEASGMLDFSELYIKELK
ncbi:MAG: ABC transporter substrate-binding protein [Crocinitomicaceae bacterium]|jgi:oligopeptide transport system substrate-binding protein|nr:ABC transporter substrate-binding protein [Crocinitomicaceae bacterium]MDP4723790.1 ABC transporter substrate-binding protein [Crocinitomicaceae bacterium]MDP4739430.1 ABC transporter substrate-binding protein [Crocinitomicaceae bacterium]MDP4805949.1 ABC transporter substrate-binding protein [Crocinitomicaceae bacterium]MDP4867903.1 ABC transporter substrate-binding protein [Crocinitomicaceae bacterium]